MHQDALCELLETVHEGKPTQLRRRFLSSRGKEIMDFENRQKNDHPVDPGYSRNGKVLGRCAMEQLAAIIHEISEPATAVALNAKAVQLALASEPPDFAIARTAVQCLMPDSRDIVEIVTQLHAIFRGAKPDKCIATDQLAIPLQESSSSNAIELGQVMQTVGHE